MAEFKKFKSIDNHYREKVITDMLAHNPVYHACKYVAQEKIDGANFQLLFTMEYDGSIIIRHGKRTSLLGADEKFYNRHAAVGADDVQEMCDNICVWMRENKIEEIILYGELFGKGVQNRINYGEEQRVLFYDVVVDGYYYTVEKFYEFMEALGAGALTVPLVADFNGIEEALKFEVEGKPTIVGAQEDGNVWEGVVIKPFDTIALNNNHEQVLFYVKKKCESFADKMKVKKKKGPPKEIDPALLAAQNEYIAYLTDNRLADVMGKHGQIESDKQVGQYIKYMMEDAKEDFFKDSRELFDAVPDKLKGKVFSVTGKIVAPMLMRLV
jgi:Rnl2 family RNA ligase